MFDRNNINFYTKWYSRLYIAQVNLCPVMISSLSITTLRKKILQQIRQICFWNMRYSFQHYCKLLFLLSTSFATFTSINFHEVKSPQKNLCSILIARWFQIACNQANVTYSCSEGNISPSSFSRAGYTSLQGCRFEHAVWRHDCFKSCSID